MGLHVMLADFSFALIELPFEAGKCNAANVRV